MTILHIQYVYHFDPYSNVYNNMQCTYMYMYMCNSTRCNVLQKQTSNQWSGVHITLYCCDCVWKQECTAQCCTRNHSTVHVHLMVYDKACTRALKMTLLVSSIKSARIIFDSRCELLWPSSEKVINQWTSRVGCESRINIVIKWRNVRLWWRFLLL